MRCPIRDLSASTVQDSSRALGMTSCCGASASLIGARPAASSFCDLMPSSIPVLTRPSKEEIRAAAGRIIPDVIAAELKVLFCGINPGPYSGATGYHFARPGNRFWPTLYRAGFMEAATGTPAGPALAGTSTGAPRGTDAAVCTGGYRRDPRPRKAGSGSPRRCGSIGQRGGLGDAQSIGMADTGTTRAASGDDLQLATVEGGDRAKNR